MEINILFFAHLRELFGVSKKRLQIPYGSHVQNVIQEISQATEASGIDWSHIKYAVNEEFSDASRVLKDQDTVVLLPPVSGG